MSDTRIPTQARSIEKKTRIIEKGFELMCEKGYHNIGTKEIALYAGVSTGIVYQYFHDKKEIFLEGVKNYSNQVFYPTLTILESEIIDLENINTLVSMMIDQFIKNHTISKKAHEELMAMTYLDQDVSNIFKEKEMEMTYKIVHILKNNHIVLPNIVEKVHIIISIVDNYCHELIYHQHPNLNYDKMKEEVIQIIYSILT